jgi:glycerate-2-kinase
MEAGLQAADPYFNTKKLLRLEGRLLRIGYPDFEPEGTPNPGEDVYDLDRDIDRIFVFGAGKGIQRVVKALEEVLGEDLDGGQIVVKHGDDLILERVNVVFGAHPVPDEGCVEGCRRMMEMIQELKLTPRDLVFTVVANGVSSLLTMPVPSITLEEVKSVTRIMQIEKGLSTLTVNFVRNQLDQLKGGRITRMLHPAKMVHIASVDLNEPNSLGGRGYEGQMRSNIWIHTFPDYTSSEEAIKVLHRHGIWKEMAPSIRHHLNHINLEQEVLRAEEFQSFDCRIYGVMPTHLNFIPVVMERARQLGYEPHLLTNKTWTEARGAGEFVGRIANTIHQENQPFRSPCALVMTGEMFVTVGKESGIGGRNQEFTLAAANVIEGSKRIVVAAADTDGTDGPGGRFNEDAWSKGCKILCGGITDGYSAGEALKRGVDLPDILKTHNASDALWRLDSGIWATQNISVQDLMVVLVMEHDG